MNSFIAISEENNQYVWLVSPTEQYDSPPPNAVCWVSGSSESELINAAKDKFEKLGFNVVSIDFYSPAPGGKALHMIIKERSDVETLAIGESLLNRMDLTQFVHR